MTAPEGVGAGSVAAGAGATGASFVGDAGALISEFALRLPNKNDPRGRLQPARFISFESNGESKLLRERFISARPVSACAIWRNISDVLWLADISAIIWPLFAAGPKSCGSNGMTASGSLSSAFAKSAGVISGRFGTPTWFRQ
jgi:hypothetical protein